MSQKQLTTGIAVAAAVLLVAFFFSGNILTGFFGGQAGAGQGAAVPEATTPGDQLVVQDNQVGTGAIAAAGDMVTVNYTAKLQDGTVVDTSVGKAPYTFLLGMGKVIPGWDQGLQGMRVGGKRLLIVPPTLGYGSSQVGPIPPNSTLVFEVELLKVEPASTTPQSAPAR